jgi:hypothetical protein
MAGGREIPILISTAAIAGTGTTITNADRIVPKSNLFILLPPFSITTYLLKHLPGQDLLARHPTCPYNVFNDLLKLQALQTQFPAVYTP